jgi:hypothetical protein
MRFVQAGRSSSPTIQILVMPLVHSPHASNMSCTSGAHPYALYSKPKIGITNSNLATIFCTAICWITHNHRLRLTGSPTPCQDLCFIQQRVTRDSVFCIATGYGLDDKGVGVGVPVRRRIFFSPRRPDRLWGPPNLPIQWIPVVLSPKRQGREAYHSPPASAEVKKI